MKTLNFDHIREAVKCLQADAIDRGLTPVENAYICTNSDYESEWDIEPDSILLLTTFTDEWLVHGDHKAAERIGKTLKKMHVQVSSYITSTRTRADYVGFAPCVANFVAGVPKSMYNRKRVRKPQPVITICYNTGATHSYSADEIAECGATLLEAVRAIEAGGVRVNLYTAQVSSRDGYYAGPLIRIKDADQPLDLLKCAYPLTSPSMLRRHKFAFIERTPGIPYSAFSLYGQSLKDGDILKQVKLKGRKFDAVLTFYDVKGSAVGDVVNQIRQQTKDNLIK